MTYTATQLEVIKRFWRKELSDYCLVKVDWKYIFHRDKSILESHYEILWHIPHLFPDVARVMRDRWWSIDYEENLNESNIWELYITHFGWNTVIPFDSIIPLLDQSESTLTQLLTLFKNV